MPKEPVEKLSELLTSLQDMHAEAQPSRPSRSFAEQVDVLGAVQEQMQAQLKLHDAQIAALREVIVLLSELK